MREPPPPGTTTRPLGPAYYAEGPPSRWRDVRAVLHPPYTAWHLSYVVIGGLLVRRVDWAVLGATVLAFFLAVGVAAHALDELRGRPLGTRLPSRVLLGAAAVSLGGAVVVGCLGVATVGAGLVAFIGIGVLLVLGYNLELFGGRLHSDVVFALAWGGFPVLVAAYAAERALRWPVLVVAAGTSLVSACQRALSIPARELRRQVVRVEGEIVRRDGSTSRIDAGTLVAPLDRALRLLSWGVTALAVGLLLARAAG